VTTVGEMTLAASERRELGDLMDQLGPDAPTLCEGWVTRDLAAHLVVRERRLDATPGILLPMLAHYTARVQRSVAQRPWADLVDLVRHGPPWWSPFGLPGLGDKINTMEFFVHHEDLRRAQSGWEPRPPDSRRAAALWAVLRLAARVLYRHSPVGVVLRTPDGLERTVKNGDRSVTLLGSTDELTLHAFGRAQTEVDIDGDQVDVADLQHSRRGL
jgi:uncharacterized protein (TIGR03085 family)